MGMGIVNRLRKTPREKAADPPGRSEARAVRLEKRVLPFLPPRIIMVQNSLKEAAAP